MPATSEKGKGRGDSQGKPRKVSSERRNRPKLTLQTDGVIVIPDMPDSSDVILISTSPSSSESELPIVSKVLKRPTPSPRISMVGSSIKASRTIKTSRKTLGTDSPSSMIARSQKGATKSTVESKPVLLDDRGTPQKRHSFMPTANKPTPPKKDPVLLADDRARCPRKDRKSNDGNKPQHGLHGNSLTGGGDLYHVPIGNSNDLEPLRMSWTASRMSMGGESNHNMPNKTITRKERTATPSRRRNDPGPQDGHSNTALPSPRNTALISSGGTASHSPAASRRSEDGIRRSTNAAKVPGSVAGQSNKPTGTSLQTHSKSLSTSSTATSASHGTNSGLSSSLNRKSQMNHKILPPHMAFPNAKFVNRVHSKGGDCDTTSVVDYSNFPRVMSLPLIPPPPSTPQELGSPSISTASKGHSSPTLTGHFTARSPPHHSSQNATGKGHLSPTQYKKSLSPVKTLALSVGSPPLPNNISSKASPIAAGMRSPPLMSPLLTYSQKFDSSFTIPRKGPSSPAHQRNSHSVKKNKSARSPSQNGTGPGKVPQPSKPSRGSVSTKGKSCKSTAGGSNVISSKSGLSQDRSGDLDEIETISVASTSDWSSVPSDSEMDRSLNPVGFHPSSGRSRQTARKSTGGKLPMHRTRGFDLKLDKVKVRSRSSTNVNTSASGLSQQVETKSQESLLPTSPPGNRGHSQQPSNTAQSTLPSGLPLLQSRKRKLAKRLPSVLSVSSDSESNHSKRTKFQPAGRTSNPILGDIESAALAVKKPRLSESHPPSEPHPPSTSAEPHPPSTSADPHPPSTSADPHPPSTSADPHPPSTSADPHPPSTSAEPHPPSTSAEPHPPDTSAKPHPPGTSAKPHPPGTSAEPHPPSTSAEPHPLSTSAKPHPPSAPAAATLSDCKSEDRLAIRNPTPSTSAKPHPPSTSAEPHPPSTSAKPHPPSSSAAATLSDCKSDHLAIRNKSGSTAAAAIIEQADPEFPSSPVTTSGYESDSLVIKKPRLSQLDSHPPTPESSYNSADTAPESDLLVGSAGSVCESPITAAVMTHLPTVIDLDLSDSCEEEMETSCARTTAYRPRPVPLKSLTSCARTRPFLGSNRPVKHTSGMAPLFPTPDPGRAQDSPNPSEHSSGFQLQMDTESSDSEDVTQEPTEQHQSMPLSDVSSLAANQTSDRKSEGIVELTTVAANCATGKSLSAQEQMSVSVPNKTLSPEHDAFSTDDTGTTNAGVAAEEEKQTKSFAIPTLRQDLEEEKQPKSFAIPTLRQDLEEEKQPKSFAIPILRQDLEEEKQPKSFAIPTLRQDLEEEKQPKSFAIPTLRQDLEEEKQPKSFAIPTLRQDLEEEKQPKSFAIPTPEEEKQPKSFAIPTLRQDLEEKSHHQSQECSTKSSHTHPRRPLIISHPRISLINSSEHPSASSPMPTCSFDDTVYFSPGAEGCNAGALGMPRLSPREEEYNQRLTDTILKLAGDMELTETPPSRRSSLHTSPAAEDDERDSSMIVSINRTQLQRQPRLPGRLYSTQPKGVVIQRAEVTAQEGFTIQRGGVLTHRLGTYVSKGVQAERGMIVDKEVLDSYLAVKLNEALYEMKEQLQATERQVKSVIKEKERLERVLHEKVKLIRDLTTTGFKPIMVDQETGIEPVVTATASTQTINRAPRRSVKQKTVSVHVSTQTEASISRPRLPTSSSSSRRKRLQQMYCLQHFRSQEIEDFLRRIPPPISPSIAQENAEPEPQDESPVQKKSVWLSALDTETSSRCIAIRPQVRLNRALSQLASREARQRPNREASQRETGEVEKGRFSEGGLVPPLQVLCRKALGKENWPDSNTSPSDRNSTVSNVPATAEGSNLASDDHTGWTLLGCELQGLFKKLLQLFLVLKKLSVEHVLKGRASRVVDLLGHLLSHLPLPSRHDLTEAAQNVDDHQRYQAVGVSTWLFGFKLKELLQILECVKMDSSRLPAYFRAEVLQLKRTANNTLNFAIRDLRHITVLHDASGCEVLSSVAPPPLHSDQLHVPPLPHMDSLLHGCDDLDDLDSSSSLSSLGSSESEEDEEEDKGEGPYTAARVVPIVKFNTRHGHVHVRHSSASLKAKHPRVDAHTHRTPPSTSALVVQPAPPLSRTTPHQGQSTPASLSPATPITSHSEHSSKASLVLLERVETQICNVLGSLSSKSSPQLPSATNSLAAGALPGSRPQTCSANTVCLNAHDVLRTTSEQMTRTSRVSGIVCTSRIPSNQFAHISDILAHSHPSSHSPVVSSPASSSPSLVGTSVLTATAPGPSPVVPSSSNVSPPANSSPSLVGTAVLTATAPGPSPVVPSSSIVSPPASSSPSLVGTSSVLTATAPGPSPVVPSSSNVSPPASSSPSLVGTASVLTATAPGPSPVVPSSSNVSPPASSSPSLVGTASVQAATAPGPSPVVPRSSNVSPPASSSPSLVGTSSVQTATAPGPTTCTSYRAVPPQIRTHILRPNDTRVIGSHGSRPLVLSHGSGSGSLPQLPTFSYLGIPLSHTPNVMSLVADYLAICTNSSTSPTPSALPSLPQNTLPHSFNSYLQPTLPTSAQPLPICSTSSSSAGSCSMASSSSGPVIASGSGSVTLPSSGYVASSASVSVASGSISVAPSGSDSVTSSSGSVAMLPAREVSRSRSSTSTAVPSITTTTTTPAPRSHEINVTTSSVSGSCPVTASKVVTTSQPNPSTTKSPAGQVIHSSPSDRASAVILKESQNQPPCLPVASSRSHAPRLPPPRPLILSTSLARPAHLGKDVTFPVPKVQVKASEHGVVIKWTFSEENLHHQTAVTRYELYAHAISASVANPPVHHWGKVGVIKPLTLPMAVTLTNFTKGQIYLFSVRAFFTGGCSVYSEPCTISP